MPDDEIEIAIEVSASTDGCSYSLHAESEEEMSYEDFLDAVRYFLEQEQMAN